MCLICSATFFCDSDRSHDGLCSGGSDCPSDDCTCICHFLWDNFESVKWKSDRMCNRPRMLTK